MSLVLYMLRVSIPLTASSLLSLQSLLRLSELSRMRAVNVSVENSSPGALEDGRDEYLVP